MKTIKSLALLALTLTMMISSCSKVENNYITVEYANVQLNGQELVATATKQFKASSRQTAQSKEYEHEFPSDYTAYFVSKQTKGDFTTGQVVDSIKVKSGTNNIRVPKLNYDVYVTNFKHNQPKWYTWNNAIEQLPQGSHKLYLLGSNNIDYSKVTVGTVELVNPYSAVMVLNNQWVNGAPTHYDSNLEYSLVDNDKWYLLYIRNSNTNSKVPVKIGGYNSDNYELRRTIEANKIYQYTIDGSVPITDGEDNFNVIVKPFEKIIEETIKL